jgi:hypothetical protein
MDKLPDDLHNKDNSKESQLHPKKAMQDMQKNPQIAKNKKYDRHSGTGRGKEISKGGAGGQYTWGTGDKQIEREAYDEEDDGYVQREPGDIKKDYEIK